MRQLATILLPITLLLAGATTAAADPAFGPGAANGQGNNDPGENPVCHPPGQTVDVPGCK